MDFIIYNKNYESFFLKVFKYFPTFPKVRKYFGILGVSCIINVILNIGFGFWVFFCIWETYFKHFFDSFRPPNRFFSSPPKSNNFTEV